MRISIRARMNNSPGPSPLAIFQVPTAFFGSDMPGRTPAYTEKTGDNFFSTRFSKCFLKQCGIRIHQKRFCSYRYYFLIEIYESCPGDIRNLLLSKGYVFKETSMKRIGMSLFPSWCLIYTILTQISIHFERNFSQWLSVTYR